AKGPAKEGSFKAAEVRYTAADQVDTKRPTRSEGESGAAEVAPGIIRGAPASPARARTVAPPPPTSDGWMSRPLILLVLTLGMPPAAAQARQFAPDARVDSVFAAYDRPDAPGCAVGVYRDGRIQYARGYGLADLERRVPISPATVFDIGSTSKQFTA